MVHTQTCAEGMVWWRIVGLCLVTCLFGIGVGIMIGKKQGWEDAKELFGPDFLRKKPRGGIRGRPF